MIKSQNFDIISWIARLKCDRDLLNIRLINARLVDRHVIFFKVGAIGHPRHSWLDVLLPLSGRYLKLLRY